MLEDGCVMIWAEFFATDKSSIELIHGTMSSVRYLKILWNMWELFIVAKHYYDCWFQQDNATAHLEDHAMYNLTDLGPGSRIYSVDSIPYICI